MLMCNLVQLSLKICCQKLLTKTEGVIQQKTLGETMMLANKVIENVSYVVFTKVSGQSTKMGSLGEELNHY